MTESNGQKPGEHDLKENLRKGIEDISRVNTLEVLLQRKANQWHSNCLGPGEASINLEE